MAKLTKAARRTKKVKKASAPVIPVEEKTDDDVVMTAVPRCVPTPPLSREFISDSRLMEPRTVDLIFISIIIVGTLAAIIWKSKHG